MKWSFVLVVAFATASFAQETLLKELELSIVRGEMSVLATEPFQTIDLSLNFRFEDEGRGPVDVVHPAQIVRTVQANDPGFNVVLTSGPEFADVGDALATSAFAYVEIRATQPDLGASGHTVPLLFDSTESSLSRLEWNVEPIPFVASAGDGDGSIIQYNVQSTLRLYGVVPEPSSVAYCLPVALMLCLRGKRRVA